jgi:hypothetical protein
MKGLPTAHNVPPESCMLQDNLMLRMPCFNWIRSLVIWLEHLVQDRKRH